MQPKYLAILTLPLKANEKTISRCRKERWSTSDFLIIFVYFFIFYYYFIIIFVYLDYLFTFQFICLANRQQLVHFFVDVFFTCFA